MKDKGTMALSSLAFGVGAAALLGVSEVSEADDPAHCALWEPCYLGTYSNIGAIYVHPGASWEVESWVSQIVSYLWGYQEVYGSCAMLNQPPVCGCGATIYQWNIAVNQFNEYLIQPVAHPIWSSHHGSCWFPPPGGG